ncbi:MAG: hypothetical protein JWP01_2942 [Myxococcales bacterium]|nr:hypothetical protein [Myxococcales bacterium]
MTGNFRTGAIAIAVAATSTLFIVGCDDDDDNFVVTPPPADGGGSTPEPGVSARCFDRIDLVSDQPGVAARVDPDLVNAWGIAPALGAFWIANAGTGRLSELDATGAPARTAGAPIDLGAGITGIVANPSTAFVIQCAEGPTPTALIVARETGELIAINDDVNATTRSTVVVNRASLDANYKGVAILSSRDVMYLLAADFHNGRVDVFDETFTLSTQLAFVDPTIPAGFAPFNVAVLGDAVYVAYAQQDAAAEDEVRGAGLGYVTKFDRTGVRAWTLTSQLLNAPWGMVLAPTTTGLPANTLLVGNFGDGRISTVDALTGRELGQLEDASAAPITIDGLWGLSFGDGVAQADPNGLYFAAGPENEAHGLYGVLRPCQ